MARDEFDMLSDFSVSVLDSDTRPAAESADSAGKAVVMIIDDDHIFRQSLSRALEGKYRVIPCQNGEEALLRIQPGIFAVLLDIKMEGLDGFETYLNLKARFPEIPIIFYTAYQNLKDPYDIINEYRPFAYIMKEGNFRLLHDTLQSAVNYSRQVERNLLLVEELREFNTSLEEKVRQRTATIAEQNQHLEEKNRIMQDELRMAEQVQNALLPHSLPEVPGARMAFRYQPMLGVGGDFVDLMYNEQKGLLGAFICDVAGHGVAAAFLAAMVKMILADWHDLVDQPGRLLENVRASLKGKLKNRFLTATVAALDPATGELTLANAGHPPTILHKTGGELKLIESRGPGIFEFIPGEFEQTSLRLDPGDRIIMYTDGIVEVPNPDGDMLEEERLREIAQRYRDRSPDEFCAAIFSYIDEFRAGRPVPDDLSLLVVEYTGVRSPSSAPPQS